MLFMEKIGEWFAALLKWWRDLDDDTKIQIREAFIKMLRVIFESFYDDSMGGQAAAA